MKFTDGNWLLQPGIKAHYPAEVFEAENKGQELELYAPTRHIRHRGDTLEGPVLTIRLSSPIEDVIRVRISHFEGVNNPGPHFPLFAEDSGPTIDLNGQFATLTAGKLTARVNRKNYGIEFLADGKVVTRSPSRGTGYIKSEKEGAFVHEQLTLGVGELVYGLGERFTSFIKNGQTVQIWNRDGGTGSDQAYKNVPFYLTNHGYGVFVNQPEQVDFEVASEKVSRVQFSVPSESLEYFVIYGPSPKEILEKYTQLTGKPALPPAWSFGLWLTTSFTTSYDEGTVNSFLDGMAERDLPLSVFHFDCFWMRAFRWCDFEWDPEVFPDPEAMLQRLHDRGLKVCVWINPYIAQRSPLFAEAASKGYLLKRKDGSVWQWDLWQPGMGIVDFTNPEACLWFAAHMKRLTRMGVDSFKTDFGERIPTEDVAWFDGSDPEKMHNFYPYLYNRVVFEALQEETGEAALFARSATAGCQQFPVHWGGDCDSTFESMAESLRGGLSLTLSGFGFWSHDIGGFEGMPPAELYKRWIAFGLMSSHSRLHGSTSYRVPWLFDDEAVDVLRHFSSLKNRLMPYLFQEAVHTHKTGIPMMRAMMLEFPQDPACHTLDRQYMLGSSLLVAPVFNPDSVAEYYVPEGIWTDLFTGRTVQGGRWVREQHDFMSMPLLVKPGTLLASGSVETRADYDFGDEAVLTIYQLDDGQSASATVPTLSGEVDYTITVTREGDAYRVKHTGNVRPYTLKVAGSDQPVRVLTTEAVPV
ncbi:alpha-xylosidase [Deinococcus cellulosilyticus]|uniref:alpha-D-xyloside xylohydrolase n=1 Tax=Deinococcus cellulosilyticus (strain DSM 18568 / NBRC 106333 / KACC 11606 / 5516J-15) TaxID=1223518 RepID=A0A511N4G6_DEIC1|nr:alpha-xylosidase [Deinococcus cellulosilyticus]GEM47271.1 alpha-xylosidase [Deinococcus cellulosilyticus NBRC 106333 = KACC 11606]